MLIFILFDYLNLPKKNNIMLLKKFISTKKLISYGKVIRFPHYETIFKSIFLIVFGKPYYFKLILKGITMFNLRAVFEFREYAKRNNLYTI
jgi:hypothetical protein